MDKAMKAGVSGRKALAMGLYKGDAEDVTLKGGGKKLKYVTDGDHDLRNPRVPMKMKPKGRKKGY